MAKLRLGEAGVAKLGLAPAPRASLTPTHSPWLKAAGICSTQMPGLPGSRSPRAGTLGPLLIHSLQKVFPEHVLGAGHCARRWGHSSW